MENSGGVDVGKKKYFRQNENGVQFPGKKGGGKGVRPADLLVESGKTKKSYVPDKK